MWFFNVTSTCLTEVEVSLKRIFMAELSMRRVIFSENFLKKQDLFDICLKIL